MSIDRAHEVRIVVDPHPPNTVAAVRVVVTATLGPGWQVRRLVPRRPLIVVSGRSDEPVATVGHARRSHRAAMALAATGRFARVEADVPIRGYAENEQRASADETRADDAEIADAGLDGAGLDEAEIGPVPQAQPEPPRDWVHRILRWEQALAAMSADVRGGRGIRIGHPDTGYTLHQNLGLTGLDLTTDRDVIDNDADALDDLQQNALWPLPFPGHGTATASVIVGHGPVSAGIVGLVQEARLVPVRAIESVVQVFDSDVAKAVEHARRVGCHVISMSLGGKGFFGLEEQIQQAVDAGLIVMAAAGNFVRFVTAPASYPSCLAVAATGPGDVPWSGSSRGPAVDVSMPGSQVYTAQFTEDHKPIVGLANGTSFAVAHLAGAAALWLAHHGRDTLIRRYGVRRIQATFLAVLRTPGVCVVPRGWPAGWGVGRVDLPSLLSAPLPSLPGPAVAFTGSTTGAASEPTAAGSETARRIAYALGTDPEVVQIRLAQLLGMETADTAQFAEQLQLHEGELVYLAYTDPGFAASVSLRAEALADVGAAETAIEPRGVSDSLAALLTARG